VTLSWELVPGAIGYLVHHAPSVNGPFEPVDHGGRDVLAVPGPAYCDTTGERGHPYWYAVASLSAAEASPGELSRPVEAGSLAEEGEPLEVAVRADRAAGRLDPVWHMLGAEHLSFLLSEEEVGGRPIGEEVRAALRLAWAELGADHVRAHSILHDELNVYREQDGEPVYDFSGVERVYELLLALGLRPVVEVGFMPRDLASDPDATIFEYRGIISPPHDWERWGELNRRLAAHLVDRFGIDEVSHWGFEIWNEANLEVFWTGTQAEYFRLYDVAARAIKSVDERLLVGGPSTAAAGWIADFLDFVVGEGSPLDFVSTHTYGNVPLDVGRALEPRGLDEVEVWWTEWGATPTHFNPISDSAWAAPFVLHGMKSVQGRAHTLAYWVVSDHFEELGRPPGLLHGGFGLLTVGNLRKPRWWALALAEELGEELVELELEGDGAGSLVDGWATRHGDGTIQLLLWNGTLEQAKAGGDPLLGRTVRITFEGLPGERYSAAIARVDEDHSNLAGRVGGDAGWPAPERWDELRRTDRLDEEQLPAREPTAGRLELELRLPMPGVVRLRLEPA
jgi:xylan 1,4-beta-xylosidase